MAEFQVGGMAFDRWLESIGRSKTAGYRWIELGMIQPINILGKFFVTREEDERFWQRAKAGDFAQETESVAHRVSKHNAP